MAEAKKSSASGAKRTKTPRRPPARTPEEREERLISLAMDKAEEKLRNGTASSQLICHFLKLGSSREAKEQEFLDSRNKNLAAKTEAIYSSQRVEELYENAIKAMSLYNGRQNEEEL